MRSFPTLSSVAGRGVPNCKLSFGKWHPEMQDAWLKTSVHGLLTNEVCIGTLGLGRQSNEDSEPV